MEKNFLQSEQWRKFQESVGRRTFHIEDEYIWANLIEHALPIVGEYGYIPRGPIFLAPGIRNQASIENIINLARENNWGWVRFDPATEEIFDDIKKSTDLKIVKAPHDMQPKEILVVDISENNEEVMAKMKSKTRYNIRLAQKKGVVVTRCQVSGTSNKCIEEFLRLTKITAKRQEIVPHPDEYYRKMLETIPAENISLFSAEYNGKNIASAIVSFFEGTATYLHGASDDDYRNIMAPYLIQWEAILESQRLDCARYDMGGIATVISHQSLALSNKWSGITKFKLGFAESSNPTKFLGSYDIALNSKRYFIYRALQRIKSLVG